MKRPDILRYSRRLVANARKMIGRPENSFIEVLGGINEVAEMGFVWDEHGYKLQLIATDLLLKYTRKGGKTSEQIDSYRQALGDLGTFLKNCKVQSDLNAPPAHNPSAH